MATRDKAICLKTTDYSETSQIVCFLTRDSGVVRLIAKGAKRPRSATGGAIDLLSEGDLVFAPAKGDGLGVLMEFSQTTVQSALRKEASRLYGAQYMIELTGEMLAEGDPHPEVFDLLHNGLARLGQADAPVAAVLAYFQWRLLKHVGLLGELADCLVCGKGLLASPDERAKAHFSSGLGGLVCGQCQAALAEKLAVEGPAMAGVAALAAAQAGKQSGRKVTMSDNQAHAVNRLLSYHISHQLGKPLKLARYVIPARGPSGKP